MRGGSQRGRFRGRGQCPLGIHNANRDPFVEKLLPCRNNDDHIVVDYLVLKGEIPRDTISTHISGPESI